MKSPSMGTKQATLPLSNERPKVVKLLKQKESKNDTTRNQIRSSR